MTKGLDSLSEFLEGKRRRRFLPSPEGVPLEIQLAGHGERLAALILDLLFLLTAVLALWLIFWLVFRLALALFLALGWAGQGGQAARLTLTLVLFLSFLLRNLYFTHFELAWRGRTPGKKICGLRVVNRQGGELTPSAVVARNLSREAEIFLPLTFLLSAAFEASWARLACLGWAAALASLPLWNKGHLRAGDLIAGTQVVAQPKRSLKIDLSLGAAGGSAGNAAAPAAYVFTPEQLAIYGVLELQTLEEFLRLPPGAATDRLLAAAAEKISRKIGWREKIPWTETRRFLTDFYAAERAALERGLLFGRVKADQKAAPGGEPVVRLKPGRKKYGPTRPVKKPL